jgi:dipeptidyl aminopeptidase/acylaminoacyl peptidase
MRRVWFATLALVCAAGAKTFTLEQVLSAPFPSDLVASPDGSKVAWLLNERGARNIWVASAPDWKGVRVTAYKEDDGTDIGQMHWTSDSRAVMYVRGGDLEFLGRPDPNPSANPDGTDQAVWIVAPGEQPRRIGAGHSPALSPKGDRVAFLHGGQVWIAPLAGAGSPELMYRPRSGVTAASPCWSPDGSKLAFVSERPNHSFIAVYDFTSRSLSYMDPSLDRDTNPAWSPDGKQIVFMRNLSGGGGRGAGGSARRAGEPWAIRVATIADGTGRQIWKAEPGPGSVFHAMEAETQLYWAAGDRILFPWERDGWQHLYSVALEGGRATLLTPGEFEVEHVSFTADRKEAIFSSNQDDIDRRHIWRVSISGGTPHAVTKGEGLEWTPVAAGGGVAFLHSDARRPARAAIQLSGEVRDLAPDSIPADFPADSLVLPQQVIYSASDGMKIHAQLFLPPGIRPGEKHKAVVFMHGGSRRQMLLGWHYMDYYNNAYGMNQYLASQGYIVLSINYRSGIGYGLNFREAINYGRGGASEYHDVEGAGLYLRSRPDVDAAHIGLWGGSYGGYLTALGLARGSDLFAAGVDFHGVHDWAARSISTTPGSAAAAAALAAGGEDSARTAYESSPIASVRTWRSPVLLIHGDDDRNVDFAQTVELAGALRRQGVYFEQLIIPDEIHGFLRHASWLRAYHAEVDFFQRKL